MITLLQGPTCSLRFNCLTAIYYCDSDVRLRLRYLALTDASLTRFDIALRADGARECECAIKITNLSCIFEQINRSNAFEVQRDPPHFMHAWASARLTCLHWRSGPPLESVPRWPQGRPPKTLTRSISCLGSRYSYRRLRLKHRCLILKGILEKPLNAWHARDLLCDRWVYFKRSTKW